MYSIITKRLENDRNEVTILIDNSIDIHLFLKTILNDLRIATKNTEHKIHTLPQ